MLYHNLIFIILFQCVEAFAQKVSNTIVLISDNKHVCWIQMKRFQLPGDTSSFHEPPHHSDSILYSFMLILKSHCVSKGCRCDITSLLIWTAGLSSSRTKDKRVKPPTTPNPKTGSVPLFEVHLWMKPKRTCQTCILPIGQQGAKPQQIV